MLNLPQIHEALRVAGLGADVLINAKLVHLGAISSHLVHVLPTLLYFDLVVVLTE